MRILSLTIAALGVLFIEADNAWAERKCGFGMWEYGERCTHGPIVCERARMHVYDSGTKQWKCWHKKGVRWRPNKKAKMKKYHWF